MGDKSSSVTALQIRGVDIHPADRAVVTWSRRHGPYGLSPAGPAGSPLAPRWPRRSHDLHLGSGVSSSAPRSISVTSSFVALVGTCCSLGAGSASTARCGITWPALHHREAGRRETGRQEAHQGVMEPTFANDAMRRGNWPIGESTSSRRHNGWSDATSSGIAPPRRASREAPPRVQAMGTAENRIECVIAILQLPSSLSLVQRPDDPLGTRNPQTTWQEPESPADSTPLAAHWARCWRRAPLGPRLVNAE